MKQPPILQSEEMYAVETRHKTIFTDLPKEKRGQQYVCHRTKHSKIRSTLRHHRYRPNWRIKNNYRHVGRDIFKERKHDCIHVIQGILLFQKNCWNKYKRPFWCIMNSCTRNYVNTEFLCRKEPKHFFVLNAANVLEKDEKLARTTCRF